MTFRVTLHAEHEGNEIYTLFGILHTAGAGGTRGILVLLRRMVPVTTIVPFWIFFGGGDIGNGAEIGAG